LNVSPISVLRMISHRIVLFGWVGYAATLILFQQVGWLTEPPPWDQQLFWMINHLSLPSWMDSLAITARNPWTWVPLYLAILAWMFYHQIPKAWKIFIVLILAVTLSDQLSASLIKPWAMRERPCHFPGTAEDCRSLVNCGTGFSFVSSHASNHFALAWTLGLLFYRRWKATGLVVGTLWAGLVGWSQIRVGVHFPLDIACGALLGILIATSLWMTFSTLKVPPAVSSKITTPLSSNS